MFVLVFVLVCGKMASAGDELSVDTVRDFMLLRGGKVTNHDLVKHFKNALTNPETRGRLSLSFKCWMKLVKTCP